MANSFASCYCWMSQVIDFNIATISMPSSILSSSTSSLRSKYLMMFTAASIASAADLNDAIRLSTVNRFLLSMSLINALLNTKINNISNLVLPRFCRSALSMCLQTENTHSCRPLESGAWRCCEAVMHAPQLQHVDDFTNVDPITCTDLALVDFVQLLLVQKPCQPIHLQRNPLLESLVSQIIQCHCVKSGVRSTFDVLAG